MKWKYVFAAFRSLLALSLASKVNAICLTSISPGNYDFVVKLSDHLS